MSELKKCTRCKKSLSKDKFYNQQQRGQVNGQIWKYLDSMCKKCRIEYSAERQRDTKRKSVEYKGGKCAVCGIEDHPCVYDFHHEEEKDFSIGGSHRKFSSLKSELDKTTLLCSNCHRKHHTLLSQSQQGRV